MRGMSTLNPLNHQTVLRVHVRGELKRAGFRGWAQREAEARGIDGWVRYLMPDHAVEMVLAGADGPVEDMLSLCAEGPRTARVAEVSREPVDPDMPIWVGFHQLPPR